MPSPLSVRLIRVLLGALLTLGLATGGHAQTSQAAIEVLLAKQEITELINKYPRALDRLDRELLMSIGHPEATVQFGPTRFPNWTAYTDWMIKAHEPMLGNNHRITNILIQVNGDTAVSECTGTATLLVKQDKGPDYEERWMHSRYLDRWSKRGGKWALDSRVTIMDYRRVLPVTAADVKERYPMGARTGRADPSYSLFGIK